MMKQTNWHEIVSFSCYFVACTGIRLVPAERGPGRENARAPRADVERGGSVVRLGCYSATRGTVPPAAFT
jgi:hypothetical protein